MARKPPTSTTIKKLFALSGNVCAYNYDGDKCCENIIDNEDNIIGEICHIEAAEKGGERFNKDSNDDYRRSKENLILLCSIHHKKTNNIEKYTTPVLQEMKRKHEEIYKGKTPYIVDEIIVEKIITHIEININMGITINNIYNETGVTKEITERLLKTLNEKDEEIKNHKENIFDKEAKLKELAIKYNELLEQTNKKPDVNEFIKNGEFEKAEESLKSSFETNKTTATEDAFQLAQLYEIQLKYNDALTYYQKATELEPNNSLYLNKLGCHYNLLGEYQKAINCYEKALKINLKNFGENHTSIATCNNNIGVALRNLGEYPKAINYYEKALKINLKNFGENHPSIAACNNNIGVALRNLEKYSKAINCYKKALKIDLKNFGENHSNIACYYNNLGECLRKLGEYSKAIEYYKKALKIDLENFGENHPQIAIYNNNLGLVWNNLKEYKKAIEYYEKALKIDLKNFGENHPYIANRYHNIGMSWFDLNEHQKAIEY